MSKEVKNHSTPMPQIAKQNTKVIVHNIRSLPIHLQEAATLQAHAVAIQEADVPQFNVQQTTRALDELGRNVLYGQVANLAKNGSRRGRRVATLAAKPIRLVRLFGTRTAPATAPCQWEVA